MRTLPATLALLAAAGLAAAPASAALWDGGGDGSNWSSGANWDPDEAGVPSDNATFDDQAANLSTIVDATTSAEFLRVNQTTGSATNETSLAANLILSSSQDAIRVNSATSAGSTLGSAGMFVLDVNGNDVILNASTGINRTQTFVGTYRFDTNGGDLYSNWSIGTSSGNSLTFNFGTGSGPTALLATGSGVLARVGQIASTGGTTNNNRPMTFNLAASNIATATDGATLAFVRIARVDSQTTTLNNSGTIDIDSNSRVSLLVDSGNGSGNLNSVWNNQAAGVINITGELAFQSLLTGASGNGGHASTLTNAGTIAVNGADATLALRRHTSGAGTNLTITNSGVLTGSTASDSLEYTRFNTTTVGGTTGSVAGRATINSTGAVSPGDGHNGSGLTSVGTLTLADFNLALNGAAGTLHLDLGGDTAGTFDVLTLATGATAASGAGDLTIDAANAKLALYYVNGYAPTANTSWTILNYGSVTGAFDLATNLTIAGATGFAANPANYTIGYGTDSATLTLIPEPGTLALAACGLVLVATRRRAEG